MTASSRGLTRAAVPSAVVLALTAGLAGCKGVAVASSTAPGSLTAVAASAPAAGPGAVSVSVTSPVTISGSVQAPVSCGTGLGYRATVSSAVVHGDQLSFSVAVPRYRGAGRYDAAVVGVRLHDASGVVTTVAGVSRVPVVITGTGGSFSVSATGSGGRIFTGSLQWTCGS